jgi:hypothetical protein
MIKVMKGSFRIPIPGSICQNLKGFPISTIMKHRHIITAHMANNSPKNYNFFDWFSSDKHMPE